MKRQMYLICDTQAEPDAMPLIAIFTLGPGVEEEDVHIVFSKALAEWKPDMDCLPVRHAADEVCAKLGGSVAFAEASQVYGMPGVLETHMMRKVYLLVEYHSDENLVETTCYANKADAIEAWRLSFGCAECVWEEIAKVRPDEYYMARSSLDMSNYYELSVIEAPIHGNKPFEVHVLAGESRKHGPSIAVHSTYDALLVDLQKELDGDSEIQDIAKGMGIEHLTADAYIAYALGEKTYEADSIFTYEKHTIH